MTCGHSKEELYIFWKIIKQEKWAPAHIDRTDLKSGAEPGNLKKYDKAIKSLVKKKILAYYKAQGRDDIIVDYDYRTYILNCLKAHEGEYKFIRGVKYL